MNYVPKYRGAKSRAYKKPARARMSKPVRYNKQSLRRSALANRDKTYTFIRHAFADTAIKCGGGGSGQYVEDDFAFNFQLGGAYVSHSGPAVMSNVGMNYTDFSSLFDSYKLKKVTITFIPRFNVAFADANNQSLAGTPQLLTAIDYDDSNTATLNQLVQYNNMRMNYMTKPISVTLSPRVAIQTYGPTSIPPSTVGYTTKANQWIDMGSSGIQHYGLKGVFRYLDTNTAQFYDIKMTYTLQCKGTI